MITADSSPGSLTTARIPLTAFSVLIRQTTGKVLLNLSKHFSNCTKTLWLFHFNHIIMSYFRKSPLPIPLTPRSSTVSGCIAIVLAETAVDTVLLDVFPSISLFLIYKIGQCSVVRVADNFNLRHIGVLSLSGINIPFMVSCKNASTTVFTLYSASCNILLYSYCCYFIPTILVVIVNSCSTRSLHSES